MRELPGALGKGTGGMGKGDGKQTHLPGGERRERALGDRPPQISSERET